MAMERERETEIVGWRVRDWADAVQVCVATAYNLLNAGEIEAKKVRGGTRIVTPPSAFLAGQANYKPGLRPGRPCRTRQTAPS
jgi:hypothetical protein